MIPFLQQYHHERAIIVRRLMQMSGNLHNAIQILQPHPEHQDILGAMDSLKFDIDVLTDKIIRSYR